MVHGWSPMHVIIIAGVPHRLIGWGVEASLVGKPKSRVWWYSIVYLIAVNIKLYTKFSNVIYY